MDVTTNVSITVKKEDRVFSFTCRSDASLGECYDALHQCMSYIMQRINEAQPQPEVKEVECIPES